MFSTCRHYCLFIVCLTLVGCTMAQGQEAVKVSQQPMAFETTVAQTAARGAHRQPKSKWQPGYYPVKSTRRTEIKTVDVIKLDNGIVEAWIVPAWGGRLIRAIDKKTGADYFKWWGMQCEDTLSWSKPGGVKPSFPFFEHGTHMSQPTGYRIVKHADGSVTVAMQMRLTQYQSPAELARYGRYADEPLFVMVSVRPGSSVVEWRQRKENPNPMPRAERMWNDTLFPTKFSKKTEAELSAKELRRFQKNGRLAYHPGRSKELTKYIYPARYVTDHGPTTVHSSPHWSNPDNWNVSHFAIDAPYGFVGVWTQPNDTSYLRINDPKIAPAAKLYSCDWDEFCEHWGGVGYVFEKPGDLLPGYQPVEFVHRFYIAQNLDGPVEFANDDVAVHVDGRQFAMMATRQGNAEIKDATGRVVGQGAIGPHTVLKGRFDGKQLTVAIDGKLVMDQTFPLDRPTPARGETIPEPIMNKYKAIVASATPEGETVGRNEGSAGAVGGITDNPRVAYRFGHFDKALELLGDKHDPASDYLRGLIAWEQGQPVDFRNADWRADYHRALLAIQKGQTDQAVALVKSYLKHVPTAWRPRLALAYWQKDMKSAKQLARENPASPEAQLVLELLGDADAAKAKQQLIGNCTETKNQVQAFEQAITQGKWQHVRRYELAGPKDK